jgi:MFS transporter, DHA1 family, inner membrane transport protein
LIEPEQETRMDSEQKSVGGMTGRELLVLLVLAAVHFANVMDFMIVMPLGEQYQKDLHITPQEFGWLVAVYGLTSSISGLLAAWFLDRFDRKSTLLALYAGFTVATLLCAASGNYHYLLVTRGLAGVFGGVMASTVMAVVGDLFADARRGRAMGIVMSSFSVASIAGIPVGLFLADKLAWWAPFAVIGAMCVPVWLLAWFVLPSVRGHLHRRHSNAWREYREVLFRSTHVRSYLLTTLLVLSSFMVVPFLTSYLVANVGRARSELFLIYLCGGLATLVTMTLIGWWADRWRKLPVFQLMAFATAIPLLLLTNLPQGTWLLVVLAFTTIFFITSSGRMVPGMAMMTASATPRHRGSFLSVNTAVSHMAMSVASIMAGWILGDTESGAPLVHFSLIGVLAASAAIIAAFLGGWIRPAPGGRDATASVEGAPTHAMAPMSAEAAPAQADAVPA